MLRAKVPGNYKLANIFMIDKHKNFEFTVFQDIAPSLKNFNSR